MQNETEPEYQPHPNPRVEAVRQSARLLLEAHGNAYFRDRWELRKALHDDGTMYEILGLLYHKLSNERSKYLYENARTAICNFLEIYRRDPLILRFDDEAVEIANILDRVLRRLPDDPSDNSWRTPTSEEIAKAQEGWLDEIDY